MWIVPEDEVERVLADGLATVAAAFDDNTIDALLLRIFSNVNPVKRAEFRELLRTTSPKIVHGWPHEQETLPCWAIII